MTRLWMKIARSRIAGFVVVIAVGVLVWHGMANLPWHVAAIIAAAAVFTWAYYFERS